MRNQEDIDIAMVCIGDELLDGRLSDTNTKHVARILSRAGLSLKGSAIVGDDLPRGVEILEQLSHQHDVIIVTGGLGPTRDDITREIVSAWTDAALGFDEDAYARMKARFDARGFEVPENNRRQCQFPARATILPNEVGSASGFAVTHNDARCFFLPGVPSECLWFVEHVIVPELSAGRTPLIQRRHHVLGLPESHVEAKLDGIEAIVAQHQVALAYCAEFPIIEITTTSTDASALEVVDDWITQQLNGWLVGDDRADLRRRVADALIERSATVCTAESCTAGGIGAALTDLSGSSAWFERGFLTYANEAKQELVGVDPTLLKKHGAVSAQVVCQMAQGARERANNTYALAVSGIAGPTGATPTKPVGTVHFALDTPEGCYHMHRVFEGLRRHRVRQITVELALALLLWHMEETLEMHEKEVHGPFSRDEVWSSDGIVV